jgi:hypothetical protein
MVYDMIESAGLYGAFGTTGFRGTDALGFDRTIYLSHMKLDGPFHQRGTYATGRLKSDASNSLYRAIVITRRML